MPTFSEILPFDLTAPSDQPWEFSGGVLAVDAPAHSDYFIDPSGESGVAAETQLNAVALLGTPPQGDFTFSARVAPTFASTFDAGVLLAWIDETNWAKLCFEVSPDGQRMVVSVVTRGVSDDANAFEVDGVTAELRVSRVGAVIGFHARTTDGRWRFVRAFTLSGATSDLRVGFEAQSPTGDGCRVVWDRISFASRTLADLRDGS